MKLKQFIIPVAGALLLGGCEADHRNDNLLDSVVYLLESDLQKALFYDIEETTDYSFRAFSSGYTVTPSELGIELSDDVLTAYNEANGTAYTALDPACYRLVNSTGSVDARPPLDDVHRAARLLGDQAARRSDVLRHPAAPDLLLFEGERGARQHPDQSRDGGDPGAGSKRRRGGVRSGLFPDARLHRLRRIRQQVGDHDRIRLRRRSTRRPTTPSTVRTTCRSRPTPSPSRRRSSKWASARPCRISRSTSRS